MKRIFLISLILMTSTAFAQDKKATALLNEVAAKIQSYENIKIDFEYKMINKSQGINESMDGVLFSKGIKYKLNVAEQQIMSNGKTMWTFLESVNEVQINDANDNEEGFNPRTFMQSWQNKFKARLISEKDNIALIELLSKEASAYNKVHVKIDKSKMQLQSLSMFDANGSEFVYLIKKFITSQSIADSEFTFDPKKYPGIEIIDLR